MSWSDLFFPGNPGRRQKTVQLYTKLITLMEANFKRTNMLIDCLHENLPGKTFSKIYVDNDGTIRANCHIIIERIEEIQAYLDEKDEKLKKLLEPELYRKLTDIDIKFSEKMELGRKIGGATLSGIGAISGIVAGIYIKQAAIVVRMASKLKTLAATTGAGIVVAVIFVGIDMIASAIIGAAEKDKLEETIDELEATLKEFEPVSDNYTMSIEKVIIYIEMSS